MRRHSTDVRHPNSDGDGGGGGYIPPVQIVKPPNGAPVLDGAMPKPKIQPLGQGLGAPRRTEESWKRKANLNGTGATHVKSFHCKLNAESLEFMDQQINQWLDEHPDHEVKFVTSAIGEWTGKIKEPNLILHLWV